MADETTVIKIQYDTDEAVSKINDLTKAIAANEARQVELKKALKEGKISQQDYATQMAETSLTLGRDSNERKKYINVIQSEIGSIKRAKTENQVLREERNKLNRQTDEGKKKLTEYNTKIDANTAIIKGNVDSQSKWYMGLTNAQGPIGGVISGFVSMGKAMWALVANPVGAIITGVVAAVGALVSIFKTFDPLIDKIEQGLAALGAIFTTLKEGFIGFFTGTKSLTEAFGGMGKAMSEAAKAAIELKKAEQEVEEMQMKLTVSSAKAKRQIDELILQSKDRTKTEKERSDLIDKALEIEKKAYEEKKAIADKERFIAEGKIANGRRLTAEEKKNLHEQGVGYALLLQAKKGITDDEIKALATALANQENILDESVAIREKAINRQNALEEKAQADREKRIEKEKEAREKAAEAKAKADEKAQAEAKKLADIETARIEKEKAEKEKAEQEEIKRQERENIRRGEAIFNLSEIKRQELELEAKSFEDKKNLQIEAANAKLANELEQDGILKEEQALAEEEHKLRLIEIEAAYQEQIRAQHQQTLNEALAGMQSIITATQGMADKRVTIISDSFSKIATINFAEIKSSKEAFMAIGTAAQGLTSLITSGHEKELSSMANAKAQELALAGDNKELQDQINKKYAKKEAELKKKQFDDDKKKALVDAAIATALAVVKALPNIAMTIIAGVLGAVQIASIASKQYTPSPAFAKGGIIGGKSHAQGGTHFFGSDGSRFEAERGEAMFVMKKDATAEIAALSAINESFGGRSWTSKSSSHLADGGEASGVNLDQAVNDAISRVPIYVRVADIEIGMTEVNRVKNAGVV